VDIHIDTRTKTDGNNTLFGDSLARRANICYQNDGKMYRS